MYNKMKWVSVLSVSLIAISGCGGGGSPSNVWTWVDGGNGAGLYGVYGSEDIAAVGNVPGARQGSASWIDASGNLWLFGGAGYSASNNDRLNDLWKFDVTTQLWTWIDGSDSADQRGTYGTQGVASINNVPGARDGAASWIDASGNLWLFGGYGFSSTTIPGILSDLWKFDVTSQQWTWVDGNSAVDQSGSYGTQGVAAASNMPGARYGATSWIDTRGALWLFGGTGYGRSNSAYYLNDLWKFSP